MTNYQKWPIYATKRMVEIIPRLCALGEKQTVVTNVLFHCFGSDVTDTQENVLFKKDYVETLNYIYNTRLHGTDQEKLYSQGGFREVVFSPFNTDLLKSVSPAIRPRQTLQFISLLEQSIEDFALYNTSVKEHVDINGLFNAVGTDFLKLVKILRLKHKFKDEISSSTINRTFKDLLDAGSDFARIDALEFASLLLSYKRVDLFTPFVDGSFRLVDILKHILSSESKIALEIFFQMLSDNVKLQVLQMLRSTNAVTGLLKYPWGLVESQNLRERQVSDGQDRVDVTINKLDLDQRIVVDSVAHLLYVSKYFKKLEFDSGHKPTLLSIYFESDVLVTCNDKIVFTIDMMVNDICYQSTLYEFLSFLWSSKNFIKVGHNTMLNIAMLSSRFDKPFSDFSNLVDLNDKRVKKVQSTLAHSHQSDDQESAEEDEMSIFKPTGYTKKLSGLLQEYNIPVMPRSRHWHGKHRPISSKRTEYLVSVARGILQIEHTLRSEGWFPCMICDSTTEREE
ncbi:conserved hypothetical protein [Theileria equi strain WA]|uniref:3'-5' exonuclease domain-containing protein n=1 Tax=Theileria equi strain WA TaxID=1537102 RepID=L1LEV7_THEEQ|nr:conserved hypothetical protein [Theileria equi strain WA]EKX73804.1 conserved hypothetical protein [Theileria equi strain WA]|eukprot:XP_004833256.1 conserved hypothetical protein [Theileria equi strain WA]